jgi:hypothetical protein
MLLSVCYVNLRRNTVALAGLDTRNLRRLLGYIRVPGTRADSIVQTSGQERHVARQVILLRKVVDQSEYGS